MSAAGIKTFMNTAQEKHAFWHGFADALAWTRMPFQYMPYECLLEPHYYRAGYLCGRTLQTGLLALGSALLLTVAMLVM